MPSFSSKQSFFQRKVDGVDVIIAIKNIDKHRILKQAYSIDGILLGEVEDTNLTNDSNKILMLRKSGDYTFLIEDGDIIYTNRHIKFRPLKRESYKDSNKIIEDTMIGVLDLEVYEINNLGRVYAIGFYTYLDNKPVLYYIDK